MTTLCVDHSFFKLLIQRFHCAGVAQIFYYEKSSNKVYSINGGWSIYNGASVLVPGFIIGVIDAGEKVAKFPLKTLFEPALYFAENGSKMPSGLAGAIKLYYNKITLLRTTQSKFSCQQFSGC